MKEPVWLTRDQVLAFHDEQLREHGGPPGIKDAGALEGALGRPRNVFASEKADLAGLAAAYAHGVVKDHPFNDGNKRTAFICAYVFLGLNHVEMTMSEAEAVDIMLALAAGEMTQNAFAEYLREHTRKM